MALKMNWAIAGLLVAGAFLGTPRPAHASCAGCEVRFTQCVQNTGNNQDQEIACYDDYLTCRELNCPPGPGVVSAPKLAPKQEPVVSPASAAAQKVSLASLATS